MVRNPLFPAATRRPRRTMAPPLLVAMLIWFVTMAPWFATRAAPVIAGYFHPVWVLLFDMLVLVPATMISANLSVIALLERDWRMAGSIATAWAAFCALTIVATYFG